MLLWLLLPGGRTRRLLGDLVVGDDDGDQDGDDDEEEEEDFDDRDADNGNVGTSDMMQMIGWGPPVGKMKSKITIIL